MLALEFTQRAKEATERHAEFELPRTGSSILATPEFRPREFLGILASEPAPCRTDSLEACLFA